MGLLPAGSHANRRFCASAVHVESGVDGLRADLCFDAQTSGGLVLAVPEEKVPDALRMLAEAGELAQVVGRVHAPGELPARLTLL